jgi:hypothetical protein
MNHDSLASQLMKKMTNSYPDPLQPTFSKPHLFEKKIKTLRCRYALRAASVSSPGRVHIFTRATCATRADAEKSNHVRSTFKFHSFSQYFRIGVLHSFTIRSIISVAIFYSPRAHVPDLAPTSVVVGRAQQKYPQGCGGLGGVFSMVAMVAKLSLMQYKIHKTLG